MRLHVVSLPHTSTVREHSWCAYSQKVLKFARMMTLRGHDVTLYASTESDFPNTVACVEGTRDPAVVEPEWTVDYFRPMNDRAIAAIRERIQPRDIICLVTGGPQQPIAQAFPEALPVEFGVGYQGTFSPYRVFESYSWMHCVYGWQSLNGPMSEQGRFYDTVIPNYFEPDQFPAGQGDGGYLLYLARLTPLKGVEIAVEVSKRTGIPLKICGQGDPPDHGEYLGVVGPEQRAELMGAAIALMSPTLYLEPFGGAAVEAQMCGTPAITTDWGAFTETVDDGVTGFRCRTVPEFVQAARWASSLDRRWIRERATSLYSTTVCAVMYERYFHRLQGLYGDGVGDFYGTLEVAA